MMYFPTLTATEPRWHGLVAACLRRMGWKRFVERRVCERFSCDVESRCHRVDQAEGTGFFIRIRDVSRGGMRIVADRPLPAGSVVAVDLPRPGGRGSCSVLADVKNVSGLGAETWSAGCGFSLPLTDEDLSALGTTASVSNEPEESFTSVGRCRIGYRPAAEPLRAERSAEVRRFRSCRIDLLLPERPEVGMLLTLTLNAFDETEPLAILAIVARANRVGPEGWAAGCRLIRSLTESEFERYSAG